MSRVRAHKAQAVAVKRGWILPGRDNWCALCSEPFGNWMDHISSRFPTHRALEMIFEKICKMECRAWDPRKAVYDCMGMTDAKLTAIHGVVCEDDHSYKRTLYKTLCELKLHGAIRSLSPSLCEEDEKSHRLQKGSHVLPYMLMRPIIFLFPHLDSGHLSSVGHLMWDNYNLEHFYETLHLHHLVDWGHQGQYNPSFQVKGFLVKSLLGDLHYAHVRRPGRKQFSPGITALAEYATVSVIAEIILLKMVDWVARAQRAWTESYDFAVRKVKNHASMGSRDPFHPEHVRFAKLFPPPPPDYAWHPASNFTKHCKKGVTIEGLTTSTGDMEDE